MKTDAVSIPSGQKPVAEIRLKFYQDRNGNYFVAVEDERSAGLTAFWTSTYTTPSEALDEAESRIGPLGF